MKGRWSRLVVAFILALSAGGVGYVVGSGNDTGQSSAVPAQTVSAPAPGTVRILYSLDKKQNDQEIIALIENAQKYIYFAIYEFTLSNVADALVSAKKRGVDVRGVVDAGESANSYDAPIIASLLQAGIPVVTEKHASGNGIMHIKALVTESTYAMGSYNWTKSATLLNDEVLEIGTDPALRQAYENILKKLWETYKGNAAAGAAAPISIGTVSYTDAPKHIGEYAGVRGVLVDAYTSASGTVFLDFCKNYKTCPFSGVIFSDDVSAFGDLTRYAGKTITLSGKIVAYQDRTEIVLSSPSQLSL